MVCFFLPRLEFSLNTQEQECKHYRQCSKPHQPKSIFYYTRLIFDWKLRRFIIVIQWDSSLFLHAMSCVLLHYNKLLSNKMGVETALCLFFKTRTLKQQLITNTTKMSFKK